MTLVRKISDTWAPAEHKGLEVGDVVDFPNPESLIAEGKVEVVTQLPKEEEKKK